LDFGDGAPGRADLRGRALIGNNLSDKIHGLGGPARHIEIVNEAVGYRMNRTLQVAAGKLSQIKLEMPKERFRERPAWLKCGSTASASARRRSGTCRWRIALAQRAVPSPGTRRATPHRARHHEGPARVSVDMRKPQ
jgi:hypothetical protein